MRWMPQEAQHTRRDWQEVGVFPPHFSVSASMKADNGDMDPYPALAAHQSQSLSPPPKAQHPLQRQQEGRRRKKSISKEPSPCPWLRAEAPRLGHLSLRIRAQAPFQGLGMGMRPALLSHLSLLHHRKLLEKCFPPQSRWKQRTQISRLRSVPPWPKAKPRRSGSKGAAPRRMQVQRRHTCRSPRLHPCHTKLLHRLNPTRTHLNPLALYRPCRPTTSFYRSLTPSTRSLLPYHHTLTPSSKVR